MEADWEFDIAADAALIDAHWSGLVDLRRDPASAHRLPEATQLPALAEALTLLNSSSSRLWTSKCDVWPEQEFDPDELNASAESAAYSLACYIDLLLREPAPWSTSDGVADWSRRMRKALQAQPLRDCRADLVIRAAAFNTGEVGFGVTAYLIGCGASPAAAASALSRALVLFAQNAVALPDTAKYNENCTGE